MQQKYVMQYILCMSTCNQYFCELESLHMHIKPNMLIHPHMNFILYTYMYMYIITYQWWEIEENEEESIGYQVVGEDEREAVGNGDASPASKELQRKE